MKQRVRIHPKISCIEKIWQISPPYNLDITWFLNYMVAQNMVRSGEVKHEKMPLKATAGEEKNALNRSTNLIQYTRAQ